MFLGELANSSTLGATYATFAASLAAACADSCGMALLHAPSTQQLLWHMLPLYALSHLKGRGSFTSSETTWHV